MAKSDKHIEETRHKDITQQAYRGTNEAVSGLGYGAIETKAGLIVGSLAGIAVGALASKRVSGAAKLVGDTLTKYANKLDPNAAKKASEHGLKDAGPITKTAVFIPRMVIRFFEWIVDVSQGSAKHMARGIENPLKRMFPKRFDTPEKTKKFMEGIVSGGTLGALGGFLFSSITGAAHGAKVASDGRKQFETAKNEIRTLRKTNQTLEGQYAALRDSHQTVVNEISEIKSGQKDVAEVPSTSINAATIDAGKRREDQTLALAEASQSI